MEKKTANSPYICLPLTLTTSSYNDFLYKQSKFTLSKQYSQQFLFQNTLLISFVNIFPFLQHAYFDNTTNYDFESMLI